jgi:hypothetical protein
MEQWSHETPNEQERFKTDVLAVLEKRLSANKLAERWIDEEEKEKFLSDIKELARARDLSMEVDAHSPLERTAN